MSKYALQAEVGFRCAGMRLENERGEEAVVHRKEWGRAIVPATVPLLFDTFFGDEHGTQRVTEALQVRNLLRQLVADLKESFRWSLYAGSILLLRDAASTTARVALVDFSYSYPEAEAGHDNLLFGVEQLLLRLCEWIDGKTALVKQTTLLLVRDGSRVLLAMKKRGLGAGKYNGCGGKRDEGESVAQAAVRECHEEIGLTVGEADLIGNGVIEFRFVDKPAWSSECHVFTAVYDEKRFGKPSESEEMSPQWFGEKELPFDSMWPDDRIWLPRVLAGEKTMYYRFWHSAATSQIVRFECLQ